MKIVHPQSCLRIWWRCLCQCFFLFFFTLWPPRADVSSGKQVLWRVKRLVRADRNTEACQDTGEISADKIEWKFFGETQLDWSWGSVFRTLGWLQEWSHGWCLSAWPPLASFVSLPGAVSSLCEAPKWWCGLKKKEKEEEKKTHRNLHQQCVE